MRAQIWDTDVLGSINHLDMLSYLKGQRWQKADRQPTRGSLWLFQGQDGDEFEAFVPTDRGLSDYTRRIAEVLQILEAAEDRGQMEIIEDLKSVSWDVLRLQLMADEYQDGTVPVADGTTIHQRAVDLLLAGASSAHKPKAYHAGRTAERVAKFVQKVRLGQTERGSYILKVLTPIPPVLTPCRESGQLLETDIPFERKVMTTLVRGMAATHTLASQVAQGGGLEGFHSLVAEGVSANLCEAVVALLGGPDSHRTLQARFSWATHRPQEEMVPNRVTIEPAMLPILSEVARAVKATELEIDDFELIGFPIQLKHTADQEEPGKIRVVIDFDGQVRGVNVTLPSGDYLRAVEAHKDGKPLRCFGTLKREGRNLVLLEPRALEVLEAEPEA